MAAREQLVAGQAELDSAKLVFIDESGMSLALSYNYGWARPGETPVIERPSRGKSINVIGAIALDGVRGLRRVEQSVNGEEFVAFLREDLGPNLNPGDVVIMDGPSIHRVSGVVEALAEFDAVPLYLPPYSPELNPIEMAWAWLKKHLRKAAPRRIRFLRETIERAWATVSESLCAGWIRHCGYAVQST